LLAHIRLKNNATNGSKGMGGEGKASFFGQSLFLSKFWTFHLKFRILEKDYTLGSLPAGGA